MTDATGLAELPAEAFRKADPAPDRLFYGQPRFVEHIDDRAVAAVTALHGELAPPGGAVLDLMSSWVSHLPDGAAYAAVEGLGMNREELDANPRLTGRTVQDLNADPALPFADAAFDAALCCVSVQYLQRPVEVFAEVARILRPGAPFAVSFSNRCFPTKAVAIWQALGGPDQCRLVQFYMGRAGFADTEARTLLPGRGGDPLWTVIGRAAG